LIQAVLRRAAKQSVDVFLNVQNVGKDFVFMEMFDAVKFFLKPRVLKILHHFEGHNKLFTKSYKIDGILRRLSEKSLISCN